MKYKLLLLILMPFSLMAARTNSFDSVQINNSLLFLGGTPGVNKVLTSDATGFYTPQSLVALEATMVTNITTTAPFLSISGQGTHTLAIAPVGTVITNGASPTFVNLTSTIFTGTTVTNGGSVFTASTAQFGANSSYVETHPGIQTYPNGFPYNAGVAFWPATSSGVGTNDFSLVIGGVTGGTSTISSGTNLAMTIGIPGGAGIYGTLGARTISTNSATGPLVMNVIFTNSTFQMARVKTAVVLANAIGSQSSVEGWAMGGGTTNRSIIQSTIGVSGTEIKMLGIDVPPGYLYMYTNTVSTPGASTVNNAYTSVLNE